MYAVTVQQSKAQQVLPPLMDTNDDRYQDQKSETLKHGPYSVPTRESVETCHQGLFIVRSLTQTDHYWRSLARRDEVKNAGN